MPIEPEEAFNLSDQQWIDKIKTQEILITDLCRYASHIPDKAWNYLAIYQKLTEKFILDYSYQFDLDVLLINQVVHEKTIRNNLDIFKNHMWHICRYQYVTESFLNDHSDIVNWKQVFLHQKHLSIGFILKNFKRFPRDEYIYSITDVFHKETYFKHDYVLGKIIADHNNKIRKVRAAGRSRS